MPKNKKANKKILKNRPSHVQYFYILSGFLIVTSIAGAVFFPLSRTGVLGERTQGVKNRLEVSTMPYRSTEGSNNEGRRDEKHKKGPIRERMSSKAGELRENAEKRTDGRGKTKREIQKRQVKRSEREIKQTIDTILKDDILDTLSSSETEESVIVTEENGKNVLLISGTKEQKLFGVFPVKIAREVTVSEESGNVTKTKTSFFNGMLDAFSF